MSRYIFALVYPDVMLLRKCAFSEKTATAVAYNEKKNTELTFFVLSQRNKTKTIYIGSFFFYVLRFFFLLTKKRGERQKFLRFPSP